MIKSTFILLSAFICCVNIQAQILTVTSGTELTIKSGTLFSADNLILIPSTDFTISNNSLSRSATAIHTPSGTYISRVYQFANISNPYSGSIQINYLDGAELNGLSENTLTLNLFDGSGWNPYPATTNDATNNFVLTTGLNNITLNELALADQFSPLPILWKSFTVSKQNNFVLLQWATSMEQGSKEFIVQYSINGSTWTDLAKVAAAGNSNTTRNYSFVHTHPIQGLNFYRIIQTDLDGQATVSEIKQLRFDGKTEVFRIMNNPVNNGILTVEVFDNNIFTLFTADGKMLWKQQLSAGTQMIDLSRYAKGSYFITNGKQTQKVIYQ